MSPYRNLIDGEWVEGPDVNRDLNPSNLDDVVGEYARADAAQARAAIAGPRGHDQTQAQRLRPGWRQAPSLRVGSVP
jgi:acyl-CoA reductase-like NAD-dependent aldehyde dehydrogenase